MDIFSTSKPNVEKMKAKRDVTGLIKTLKYSNEKYKNSEVHHIRHQAVEALSEVGDARAIEPLVETMKDDSDKLLGSEAAQALGAVGDKRAVEPLIEALRVRNFMDDTVAAGAALALGTIGDPRAVEPLVQAIISEHPDVQRAAALALDKLGWEPLDNAQKAEYLVAKHAWSLWDGRDELKGLGSSAVEPLIRALNNNAHVREDAAVLLGTIGDLRAVGPLIEALQDKQDGVRMAAAGALGEIGNPRAVEPLVQTMRDKQPSVGKTAARVLDKLGWQPRDDAEKADYLLAKEEWGELVRLGEAALEPLIRALKQGPKYQVLDAVKTLGELGDRRAIQPLMEALKNWYYGDVRDELDLALYRLRTEEGGKY